MPYARPDALVSTEWLAAHLDAPDVRVVDGSFYLPAQKRDAKAEFAARHIPGAVFFDIEEISDSDNPLPHMMPAPEKFSARVRLVNAEGNTPLTPDVMVLSVGRQLSGIVPAVKVGDVLKISTASSPDLAGVKFAIGGGPRLVDKGRPVKQKMPKTLSWITG